MSQEIGPSAMSTGNEETLGVLAVIEVNKSAHGKL